MAKTLMSISSKRKKNKDPQKPLFIITILIDLGNFILCFPMWLYMFPGFILTSSDIGMLWHMPAWPHTELWCLCAVWATISSSDIWGQYFTVRHGLEMFYWGWLFYCMCTTIPSCAGLHCLLESRSSCHSHSLKSVLDSRNEIAWASLQESLLLGLDIAAISLVAFVFM